MKYIAFLKGRKIDIDIIRKGNLYCLTIGDNRFTVDAFQPRPQSLSMLIEGKSYEVGLAQSGDTFIVSLFDDTIELELLEARKYQAAAAGIRPAGLSGPLKIQAPMPGKIVKVIVQEKVAVKEGDSLLIMEAMKMQNELKAPKSGIVSRIEVREGEPVSMSQVLMIIE
jgi:biotin carboxyl carrier protein